MKTKILDVSDFNNEMIRRAELFREKEALSAIDKAREYIAEAAAVIEGGGLVAFPTETVYGLGANALDADAVGRLYAAKGRPSDNPMIVHIARASDIGELSPKLSPEFVRLADNFWPGPLSMVMRKKDIVPERVTGGLETVAVRLPDDPVALELIRLSGCPIAAPSANLSGSPSPTRAQHVIADLDGRVDIILAGGDCRVGLESTVVDMTASPPEILRPGIITADMLSAALTIDVLYDPTLTSYPRNEVSVSDTSDKSSGQTSDQSVDVLYDPSLFTRPGNVSSIGHTSERTMGDTSDKMFDHTGDMLNDPPSTTHTHNKVSTNSSTDLQSELSINDTTGKIFDMNRISIADPDPQSSTSKEAGFGEEDDFHPRSPGMKYKHYAPKAEMIIIEGHRDKVSQEIDRLKKMNEKLGNKVGILLFEEQSYIEAAHDFYSCLRSLDEEGVDLILAGALSDKDGVGFAVMNRMMKSAGYKIARV